MGMARGETSGDRGTHRARGEPVAALAISAAYDEHGEPLRRYIARYTGEEAAAEDLVHEAFVRLLAESAAGRPPVHVRAWLFRVVVNLATSRARRQGVAGRGAAPRARRAGPRPLAARPRPPPRRSCSIASSRSI
jgi:DNA-directed RNA polymerase specialized sigma24 family protein